VAPFYCVYIGLQKIPLTATIPLSFKELGKSALNRLFSAKAERHNFSYQGNDLVNAKEFGG